jgi:hypothetical protein
VKRIIAILLHVIAGAMLFCMFYVFGSAAPS